MMTVICFLFNPGELHRLHAACGGSVCQRGGEAEAGAVQAGGAGDPGALRARPRLRRRRLQDAQEAKAISIRKFLIADTYMNVGACDRFYSYLIWSLHRSLNKVLSRSWLNNHELALPRSFHLGINVREIRPIFRRSDLH